MPFFVVLLDVDRGFPEGGWINSFFLPLWFFEYGFLFIYPA